MTLHMNLPVVTPQFDLEAFRDRFKSLIRERRRDEAHSYLDDMLEAHPQSHALHFEAGFEFERHAEFLQQFSEKKAERLRAVALKHFSVASDLMPQKYPYAFRAGSVARKLGSGAALVYLERAIHLDSRTSHPWYELGLYHERFERGALSVICFQNVARLDRKDPLLPQVLLPHEIKAAMGPLDMQPLFWKASPSYNP